MSHNPPVFTLTQISNQLYYSFRADPELPDGAPEYGPHSRTWVGATVHYSLPGSAPALQGDPGNSDHNTAGFVPLSAHQADYARTAFELWDDLIAINLVETSTVNEQITFAYSSEEDYAGTLVDMVDLAPGDSTFDREIEAERIWFSSTHKDFKDANIDYGTRGFKSYVHEIGHSLGLSHPGPYENPASYHDDAVYAQDTRQYTLMSYFDPIDAGTVVDHEGRDVDGDSSPDRMWSATPLLHDVMAIQGKYGADMTTRTGDDTYGFNYRSSGADRGVFDFTRNLDPIICIWDANGNDTLDVSGYAENQRINLESGVFSDIGRMTFNVVIAYGATIENAVGGSGHDTINGNGVGNTLRGMNGDDYLTGLGGNDVLIGDVTRSVGQSAIGNDTLDGSEGADTLFGGRGNDVYVVDNTGDVVSERMIRIGNRQSDAGGNDTVISYLASFDLSKTQYNVENLESAGVTDTFTGTGNDLGNYIAGSDVSTDTLFGGAGNDTLSGGDLKDFLYGGGNNDHLLGGAGDDALYGDTGRTGGDDTLDGGEGGDFMRGGNGNDVYVVDSAFDVVSDTVSIFGRIVRGSGFDEIRTTFSFYTLFESTLSPIEALAYIGDTDFFGTGNSLSNRLTGGIYNDTLVGGLGNDTLLGGDGDDSLYGEDDNDELLGGNGNDFLDGEAGNDTVNGGEGDDTVVGGSGNDYLIGGSGADELDGATGNDRYRIIDLDDEINEFDGEGIDLVYAELVSGFVLPDFVENLDLIGDTGTLTATGNELSNFMRAVNAFFNSDALYELYGMAGNDTLWGANQDGDLLDGGAGDDYLRGLGGGDVLRGGEGADTLNGGGGNDKADYSLAADSVVVRLALPPFNPEPVGGGDAEGDVYISIENVDGSAFGDDIIGDENNNRLRGLDGDDFLEGGGGADTLEGGAGNDHLVVDNQDFVSGGAGDEDYAIASASTIANGWRFTVGLSLIENIEGNAGSDRIDGTGINYDLYIVSNGGHDTIIGGNKDDSILAGSGNDSVNGGAGFDQISGEAGNDTLVGGGPASSPFGDRLFGGTGNDNLTGSGNGLLYGEEDNDTIFAALNDYANGGSGNDSIVGGAGFQQIEGGSGNDTMTGGTEADYFDFGDGWGQDRITDFELGIDKLRLTAVTGLDLYTQLTISNGTGGALITFSGNSILLLGITDASLVTSSQFEL